MSVVMKPSQSHTWFFALVIIVIALVVQLRRADGSNAQQPVAPPEAQISRTQTQQANLEAAVSGAIGIDKSRGDSVSVIMIDR